MQNGELPRSKLRLIEMLRPENVGNAAQTAMTWLKPQPSSPIDPIGHVAGFSAPLGRLV